MRKVIVDKVKSRWLANEHKRRMPLLQKLVYEPWETILGFQDTHIKVEPA